MRNIVLNLTDEPIGSSKHLEYVIRYIALMLSQLS